MSKLRKLITNPRKFVYDAQLTRNVLSSLERVRTGPFRASFGVDVTAGVTSQTVLAALRAATPLFTMDSALEEAVECGCWLENVDDVVHAAAILATTLCCELAISSKKRPEPVALGTVSVGKLISLVQSQPSFELIFSRGRRIVANVNVAVWEKRVYEGLAQCRADNIYAKRLPLPVFDAHFDREQKHLRLRELYAQSIDNECAFDVDFVYTWVNHRDPHWRELIGKFRDPATIDWDRYVSVDELRYSLRSVAKHAPWVRKIFVVTNCAPPSWYRFGDKVVFVPHEQVFPSDLPCLPTFNSHSIEACLANVPDLREHFVYFNDDFFLSAPVAKSSFFTPNGCSKSYLEPYGVVIGDNDPEHPDYMNAAINGRRLIERDFGRSPTQLHLHVPYALRRSVLKQLETQYAADFARVRQSRFRNVTDISVVSFLYHHYAYQKREAVRDQCRSLLVKGNRHKKEFELLQGTHDVTFFCVNDGEASAKDVDYLARKAKFLAGLFPTPAGWEQ